MLLKTKDDTFTGNCGYSAERTTGAKNVKGLRAKMRLGEMEHLTERGWTQKTGPPLTQRN